MMLNLGFIIWHIFYKNTKKYSIFKFIKILIYYLILNIFLKILLK